MCETQKSVVFLTLFVKLEQSRLPRPEAQKKTTGKAPAVFHKENLNVFSLIVCCPFQYMKEKVSYSHRS